MSKERFEIFGKIIKDNEEVPNLLDNYLATVRLNEFNEKIKDLQSQLDQANERLKGAIVLPFILPTYYLCGEWHTKILLGFDNYSSPKMEYFHNKEKDKVIKQAEQKLKELRGGE